MHVLGQAVPKPQAQQLKQSQFNNSNTAGVPSLSRDDNVSSEELSNQTLVRDDYLLVTQDSSSQSQGTCPPRILGYPVEIVEDSTAGERLAVTAASIPLDPGATSFVSQDRVLGRLRPVDLAASLEHVQQVQDGGVGFQDLLTDSNLWNGGAVTGCRVANSKKPVNCFIGELPFSDVNDFSDLLGVAPKEVHKVGQLLDLHVKLPVGDFYDKVLPTPSHILKVNEVYTPYYFIALHNLTAAAGMRDDGSSYPAFTPNHIGARITLPHIKLKLSRWRYHLRGYDLIEICQHLEFGFPVGISLDQELECKTRNHGSSYMWYSYVDKFIVEEVSECGVTGPFNLSPWKDIVVSPLMTAHKKPRGRRTVFDATYGDFSVNNATSGDCYLGQPTAYTYPRVEDYRVLILKAGKGSYMWKRDLSRFFLQLPMDPVDFNKVGMIWRGLFFFFIGLAFGLRHSGLNGQRVTDAVTWIHRRLGLDTAEEKPYNVVNYVDDLGGVESELPRATASYKTMGWLLDDLGLAESTKKAEEPTTCITFLGVEFDSEAMEMRVPAGKLQEIKSEIRLWLKRTTISKKELQSLLGKLFWVGRVVKHSRVFLGRMLEQLRSLSGLPDSKKVTLLEATRKDILWWASFLEHYNGVELMRTLLSFPIHSSWTHLMTSVLGMPHLLEEGPGMAMSTGVDHFQGTYRILRYQSISRNFGC